MQCDRVCWPSRRPTPLARFRARPYKSLTNRQAARSMFSIRVWPIRVISPLSPLESKVLAGARANPSERERKMMNPPGRPSDPSRVLPGQAKKVGINGLARNRQRTKTDRADYLCIRARLEYALRLRRSSFLAVAGHTMFSRASAFNSSVSASSSSGHVEAVLAGTQVPRQPFVVIVDGSSRSGVPVLKEMIARDVER